MGIDHHRAIDIEAVRSSAQRELDLEQFFKRVAAEKARLRAQMTLRQRLADLIPFTVTIRRKQ